MTARPIVPARQARRTLSVGLGLALFVTFFVDIAVLVVPLYDMQLYDRVLLSRNMNTVAMLSVICAAGLGIYALLDFLRSATLVTIADRVGRCLTAPVLDAAVRRGMEGDSSAGADALRDLNELRSFLSSGAVATPLDALCAPVLLAVMFMLHPAFGWLAMAGMSVLTIIGIINDVLIRPGLTAAAQERAKANYQFAVGLNEPDFVDGLGMFPALGRRWARRHALALAQQRRAGDRSSYITGFTKVVRLAFQGAVIALGVCLIIAREASAGSLMGANLLLAKVLGPFDHLVASWRHWVDAAAAWKRLRVLLSVQEDADGAEIGNADGTGLVLQGVCFNAPRTGRRLLTDINLELPAGTATALLGPNGAGKSTLLRLLVGLLPPTQGSVQLDGVPVSCGDRQRIGYLPQGVHLLDGTVAENIARFSAAATDDVIHAARTSDVHEFIGRLAQGYETHIGQATSALSGGQRQRVGLARALYGSPRLLVLDEPDASLDQLGEESLMAAIDAARHAGSIIVVATHRPKLLAHMDYTLTLRDGQLEPLQPARPIPIAASQAKQVVRA